MFVTSIKGLTHFNFLIFDDTLSKFAHLFVLVKHNSKTLKIGIANKTFVFIALLNVIQSKDFFCFFCSIPTQMSR